MNKIEFGLLSIGIGILSLVWVKFAPAKWIEPLEGKFRSKLFGILAIIIGIIVLILP